MLSKEDKVLKNIATKTLDTVKKQEKKYGMKNCLQHSPINIGHSQL